MSADGSRQTADKQFRVSSFKLPEGNLSRKTQTCPRLATRARKAVAYLVRSLELAPESFISRLARST